MTRTKALFFSLGIVLLGVAVRAAPHLDRVAQIRVAYPGPATGERKLSETHIAEAAVAEIPSRLSQRSTGLLLIGLTVEALLIGAMLYIGARSRWIAATFGAPIVPIVAVLEWAAPLALVSRSFRRAWLAFAFAFHSATGLLMHLFFWESMLLAAVVIPALDRLAAGIPGRGAGGPPP